MSKGHGTQVRRLTANLRAVERKLTAAGGQRHLLALGRDWRAVYEARWHATRAAHAAGVPSETIAEWCGERAHR